MKDFYAILEIARTASPEVIQASYRLLAKRYHPDNQESGNPTMFRAVKEAHDNLIDPAKRAAYDAQTAFQHPNASNTAHPTNAQPNRIWMNGVGWVIPENVGTPNNSAYPQPQQPVYPEYPMNGGFGVQNFEQMMREAAGGVAHSLADQIVDEVLYKIMNRGGR